MKSTTTSRSTYFAVWLALLLLLALTWGTAIFDLGIANTIIALIIATTKMLLVVLFFMQIRYHSRLTKLFAGAGLVWLLIMITLTLTDYLTRKTVTPYGQETPPPQAQLMGKPTPGSH
jgi:cytochrome c oxidase subunit IV